MVDKNIGNAFFEASKEKRKSRIFDELFADPEIFVKILHFIVPKVTMELQAVTTGLFAEIEVKIAEINLREKQYLFDQFKFLNDEKKELVILKKKASWFQSKEITNIEKDILITLDNRLLSTQQEMSKLTSYTDELRNIGKESQPLKITSSSLEMIVSLF